MLALDLVHPHLRPVLAVMEPLRQLFTADLQEDLMTMTMMTMMIVTRDLILIQDRAVQDPLIVHLIHIQDRVVHDLLIAHLIHTLALRVDRDRIHTLELRADLDQIHIQELQADLIQTLTQAHRVDHDLILIQDPVDQEAVEVVQADLALVQDLLVHQENLAIVLVDVLASVLRVLMTTLVPHSMPRNCSFQLLLHFWQLSSSNCRSFQ